jgi:CubicO group peptidase (beta-lactamase class C family)
VAIGNLVERGELSFDDTIGDVVDRELDPSIAALSIDDLLTHCTSLWRYPAEQFLLMPAPLRTERVCSLHGNRQANGVARYAEFVGWELLRLVIEDVTGESFVDFTRSRVLAPFGIDNDIAFDLRHDDRRRRLRINVDLEPGVPLPLLWERSDENLADVSAASGALATMKGLASFYHQLLDVLALPVRGLRLRVPDQ